MTKEILIILLAVVLIALLLAAQNRGYGYEKENGSEKKRNNRCNYEIKV
jgi:FtsZ-interacting cell division protein ZipA